MKRIIATIIVLLSCAQVFAADVLIKQGENAQAKIDASAPGDKITVEAGYSTSGIQLKSDREYVMPRINGTNGSGFTINARGLSKAKVDVLLANANMDISGATSCTFIVSAQDFKGRGGDAARHCVYFDGLNSCTVRGPEFRNMLGGDTCIFGWNPKKCVFEDFNGFNIHEGIHIFFGDSATVRGDNIVQRVYIDGIRRHGLEFQNVANGLTINTVYVTGRFSNGMDISCATGGKPGTPGNGTTQTSWNVWIKNCVFEQGHRGQIDWSQSCGIEAMGQITIENCWFVNTGQGILYGAVGPDWAVRNSKFKNVTKPMSGEPIAFTFPPKAQNFTNNDLNYQGTIPTWPALLAMSGVTPPIPTPPPVLAPTVTAYRTRAGISHPDLAVTIKKFSKDGREWPVSSDWRSTGLDSSFTSDQSANTWEFDYEALKNNVVSPRVRIQLKPTNPADPGPPATQPVPTPVTETILDGTPWDITVPIENGKPNMSKATTKAVN